MTDGLEKPSGIALDLTAGKMYWTDVGPGKVQRGNLDGSDVEDFVAGLVYPGVVAVDPDAGKLYWSNNGLHIIQRANLDGSDVENLLTVNVWGAEGLAIDPVGGKLYGCDRTRDEIWRANLDGANPRLLTSGLRTPNGIAVDVVARKMYWGDLRNIKRADLNGSNIETVVSDMPMHPPEFFVHGVALDVSAGIMRCRP